MIFNEPIILQADAYVNTTNPNLDLSQGAVAQVLLKAGGKNLQDACNAKAPLNEGEVVATKPGNIPCQYILHTVVPNFDKRGGKSQKVIIIIFCQKYYPIVAGLKESCSFLLGNMLTIRCQFSCFSIYWSWKPLFP